MSDLLEFKNVTKTYSRGLLSRVSTTALNDISLKLETEQPTILTVAGESGSGKTTLAMLLLGFITPTSGQILYKGKDIQSLRGEERMLFRREVQAVFQDPFAVFNPFYTVDHLLTVPIDRFKLAKSKSEARAIMMEALTAVGLRPGDVLGRFPHQLSGGQRQRINVARALVLRPKLLVADEPVSMVDASLRANILETLRGLQRDHGVSIIYITHDLTTAYHIAESAHLGPAGRGDDLMGPDGYRTSLLFQAGMPELRNDPRFARLCARLGLVEFWLASGQWPDCADEVPYDFRRACEQVHDVPKDDFGF